MGRFVDSSVGLGHGAVSRPRRALLLALLVVIVAAAAATRLTPASPQGLLARSSADVAKATVAQEKAFGGEPVVVVLEGNLTDTTLAPSVLPKVLRMEDELAAVPGVKSVIGPGTFVDRAVSQMYAVVQQELGPVAEIADKAARRAERRARASGKFTESELQTINEETRLKALGPLGKQYEALLVRFGSIGFPALTNSTFVDQLVLGASPTPKKRFAWLFPDGGHALVIIRPKHGLSDAAVTRLGRDATRIVAAARLPGITTSVAGAPLVVAEATSTVADEMVRLAPVVIVAMLLALLLGLGIRNRAVHLIVPAGAAVAVTAGFSWPLGLGFTPATLAALPVVLGLAIDYVVQLQARYWTERAAGREPRRAADVALRKVGPTLLLAGGVMAAGFLALLASPVPLVGRLGVTLAVGVGASLLSLLTIAAPLMVVLDRPGRPLPRVPTPGLLGAGRPRTVAAAGILAVTLVGLALSHGTPVQSDLRRLADRNMPELVRLEALQKELGTGGQIRIAVTGRNIASPAGLAWMASVQARILGLGKGLQAGPNLASIVSSSGQGVPDAAAIPRILRLIPPDFVNGILTRDHRRAELSFGIPLGSAGAQAKLIARMQRILGDAPDGISAHVAGLQALSASSVNGLQDERPWLLAASALIIFLLLLAARRDVRRAAIPLVPALFAAGLTAVVIEAIGLQLSPLSAGLDPLVLAVGVEFGLLLEARYREERVINGREADAAARRALELLATPLVVAAGTVALGFLVLTVSRLPVLQQFGLVAALELMLSVLSAIVIVPVLCIVADRRRAPRRRAERPSTAERPVALAQHEPVA
ncbi:MMPL family transporter [Paraconexibacter antarcticus]|uniref:MMPL family transporter n=1 Tax=Paraconexibacter antarcticus TaxID=2949664 RepID=A0ABY5DVB1_9ACTN|nr:MMPL family transporter [Paraconexibacter antarcticus]UTI65425.1 MMPL family transporter [Paraconexibacter antarcticus]